jgi:hypothetical protein
MILIPRAAARAAISLRRDRKLELEFGLSLSVEFRLATGSADGGTVLGWSLVFLEIWLLSFKLLAPELYFLHDSDHRSCARPGPDSVLAGRHSELATSS